MNKNAKRIQARFKKLCIDSGKIWKNKEGEVS